MLYKILFPILFILVILEGYSILLFYMYTHHQESEIKGLQEQIFLINKISEANYKLADVYIRLGAAYKNVVEEVVERFGLSRKNRGVVTAILEDFEEFDLGEAMEGLGGPVP